MLEGYFLNSYSLLSDKFRLSEKKMVKLKKLYIQEMASFYNIMFTARNENLKNGFSKENLKGKGCL